MLEAIADLLDLPVAGGSKNEAPDRHGPERRSPLAPALRPTFAKRPPSSFFFRAEFQSNFASLLDQRREDPDFLGNPYETFGGKSLHHRSHGEAFMLMLESRLGPGLFLLDEPESALSPHRQLTLLAKMIQLAEKGATQFIVATHSAMVMTFPGATILGFDQKAARVKVMQPEETRHYEITKGMLKEPEKYWGWLRRYTD